MKNFKKLLLAAVLIGAAVVSAPKTASANPWCGTCDASGGTNCFACCKCDGGTTPWCIRACP